ncbi:MAG: S-layer homology domain-containing protein [Ruminococcaceae bacterium]|nr:S-layer homology domain-containing protein [Oscillospiraceae bacterium]
MKRTKLTRIGRRLGAFVTALCLALSLMPALGTLVVPAKAAFSDDAMDKLHNWGVVGGYPDGSLRPERNLTRAEFVAMVNRAYGYTKTGDTPFIDVAPDAWYHDDIGAAYNAGYFTGYSPRMAHPDDELTREQAVVLLARNMRLDPVSGEVTEFSDGRSCSDWSRGYIRAAQQAGLIGGYPDGSYKPQNNITRGEMAVMLQRSLGTLINKPGVHTLSDVYGNVTISTPNTTLKDSTIAGDLYITGGLDLGDITLENVRVLGDIIVAGGGESQSGKDSIVLRNVEADSLLVDSIADQFVTVRAEGNTEIAETVLRSDSYVQDRTRPGQGLLNISLESADPGASFTLSGNLETVVNKTPDSTLTVAMGTVDSLTIDEHATNATLNLDINSTAMELNLDVATSVTGVGDIDKLYVNAAGTTVEMLPDTITIRPGLTSNIAGEDLNAAQAQESSSDPRLLAGYPKLKNIAPTSATSFYSANKAGTVYWAVSTTTDGSIPEDELVDPTEGNTRITLNGTLPITESNKEFTQALEKLTPDSNYYLSTVMVDARDRHSPVKVAAFSTPDNTVPAFLQGYPRIVQNTYKLELKENDDGTKERVPNFYAQAGVMANKSCQIYYALYPAGSAQPTGQQFRTGSLGKPIQSGVEDITKNVIWLRTFAGLEELTSYDLYFWLTDADGARSSAVQKLTFTTVDGTPPRFQYETPLVVGNPPATSIPTKVNVNENATVYWAVVKHGDDFTKFAETPADADTLTAIIAELTKQAITDEDVEKELDTLKRKIESGSGSARNGSSVVTASRDANISITGLTAETAYDIYYVAKDRAGNYSDVALLEGIRTLDTNPPTVRQEFSRTNEKGEPYADTDINLIFSEDIQRYPSTYVKNDDGTDKRDANGNLIPETLTSVAKDPEKLDEFLSNIISLYNDSGFDPTVPLKPYSQLTTDEEKASWTIDFSKATVKADPDTGEVTVTLSTSAGALNLKSGATYHFVFDNLQDLATTPNRMQNMPVALESFRTIAAQVQLRKDVSVAKVEKYYTTDLASVTDASIEIDMAFSLRPISVNVEESVLWDLLLWSNTTVEFDLYTRERNSTNSNPWQKVVSSDSADHSAITVRPNSGDYIAKGRYSHLAYTVQPSVRSTLDPEKTYEYAIHFTKVGDIKETIDPATPGDGRKTWNQEIAYRVTVITADTPTAFDRLNSYSGGIGASDYAWMKNTQNVLEINTTDQNSDYFTLYKSFSDRSAPLFIEGYPSFVAQDIGADIRVMTDRAGTIYWVAAPITSEDDLTNYSPDIPPTATVSGSFDAETIAIDGVKRFAAYFTPTGGSAKTYIPHKGSDDGAPFALERPTISAIYNPNFGSTRVRSGSIKVTGSGVQTIHISDLTPSTGYYVYFVTQSDGQAIYSDNTTLYQFWTEAVSRPKLYIDTNGSAVAKVRSRNMDAVADYAIFLKTGLPSELRQKFDSAGVLGSNLTAFHTAYAESAHRYRQDTFTVYDALCEQDAEGGTLYDKYASTDHKDALRKLITGQTYSQGRVNSSANVPLTQDVVDAVDCEAEYGIQPNLEYLFIASARSLLAAEGSDANSYGFCAYEPIFIVDNTAPKIVSIAGEAHMNLMSTDQEMGGGYTVKKNTMSGKIYLIFDKDIYYYKDAATNLPFSTGTVTDNTKVGYDRFQSDSNVDSSFQPIAGTATGSDNVNGITLEFKNVPSGKMFYATANLVSYYSKLDLEGQLKLALRYDTETQKVYVDIVSNRTDWYSKESEALPTEVLLPAASGLTLSTSAMTLESGKTAELTATVTPTGSTGEVRWTVEPAGYVGISPSYGNKISIIADTVTPSGGVTVTAHLYVDGNEVTGAKKDCKVTVVPTTVKTITLSKSSLTFSGGMQSITATIDPANAADLELIVGGYDESKLLVEVVDSMTPNVKTIYISPANGFTSGTYNGSILIRAHDGGGARVVLPVSLTLK